MKEINNRRSIRSYTGDSVSSEKIEELLRAAMQAPSAGNQQPWEFIVVQDEEMLAKLSNMSPYSAMVKDCSVAFVLLANEQRYKFPDNWEQDMAAATENLLLEAVAQGLGSVWLGVAPLEDRMTYIANVFDLPSHIKPFAVVPVGYPGTENIFVDRYDQSRVHKETF